MASILDKHNIDSVHKYFFIYGRIIVNKFLVVVILLALNLHFKGEV
jgi:hypothetical protein